MAKGCLTVRMTIRTGMLISIGHSDPMVLCGKAIANE